MCAEQRRSQGGGGKEAKIASVVLFYIIKLPCLN